MSDRQRPHLVWTAVVLAGVLLLGGAAYWVWSGGLGATSAGPNGGDPASGGPGGGAMDPATSALDSIAAAVVAERFDDAARMLDEARERFGDTDAIVAAASSLELRSRAFRAALRPIEFRVESYDSARGFDVLYARVRVGGRLVHATEELVNSFGLGSARRRANLFTLRTSLDRGASIEMVEPGGILSSEEVVFGPVELAPLPHQDGGLLEFSDPDAEITRLVVGYRISPFSPGLHPDEALADPAQDASASTLVAAITTAIEGDRLDVARRLHARLVELDPAHPDATFVERRIEQRSESLRRNRRTARFTVVEAACDPKTSGKTWSTSGSGPSFRAKIEVDGDVVASAAGGPTVPYLVPGETLDPPPGNVLEVTARGDAPLRLRIVDTSPTFGATEVGAIDLPVTLCDMPRGRGLLVVEREPTVLVLPDDDANRLRRVVLRWTVSP